MPNLPATKRLLLRLHNARGQLTEAATTLQAPGDTTWLASVAAQPSPPPDCCTARPRYDRVSHHMRRYWRIRLPATHPSRQAKPSRDTAQSLEALTHLTSPDLPPRSADTGSAHCSRWAVTAPGLNPHAAARQLRAQRPRCGHRRELTAHGRQPATRPPLEHWPAHGPSLSGHVASRPQPGTCPAPQRAPLGTAPETQRAATARCHAPAGASTRANTPSADKPTADNPMRVATAAAIMGISSAMFDMLTTSITDNGVAPTGEDTETAATPRQPALTRRNRAAATLLAPTGHVGGHNARAGTRAGEAYRAQAPAQRLDPAATQPSRATNLGRQTRRNGTYDPLGKTGCALKSGADTRLALLINRGAKLRGAGADTRGTKRYPRHPGNACETRGCARTNCLLAASGPGAQKTLGAARSRGHAHLARPRRTPARTEHPCTLR